MQLESLAFVDFVRNCGGDVELAEKTPSCFYNSPSITYFPTSPHRRKEFTKSPLNEAVTSIFQHVIFPICYDNPFRTEELSEAFGFNLFADKNAALKSFWFSRASAFQFCPYGSCAWRASFAATKLAKIFQNTDMNVFLNSAKTKDQFTVVVGSKTRGWFVYDALTNPDKIFPIELYNQEIVGTFSDRKAGAESYSLKITSELVTEYEAAWPRIQKLYKQYVAKTKLTVKSLKKDHAFVATLQKEVKEHQFNKVCQEAINIFTIATKGVLSHAC